VLQINEDPMLTISEITIHRHRRDPLVEDLTLSVGAGQMLALIGHSGAGKSSLLNVIAGFIPRAGGGRQSIWQWFERDRELSYRGTVEIEGAAVDDVPVEQRRSVSMVMQGGFVYEHMSVLDNVTFPLRAAGVHGKKVIHEKALKLLDDVDLFDDLRGAEQSARLAERASSLSGGERQRVALARALAKDPRVLLLDEAFANLDPVLREELFTRLTELVSGKPRCGVVITHDLGDLKHAEQVLLLRHEDNGRGHRLYQRQPDGTMDITHSRADGSDYWRVWDEKIRSNA
jgi:ABC-type nitrate/sulfonate/bicarbonate transport system ATPase subunit